MPKVLIGNEMTAFRKEPWLPGKKAESAGKRQFLTQARVKMPNNEEFGEIWGDAAFATKVDSRGVAERTQL